MQQKKKKKMGIIVFPKSINMLILVLFFICIKLVTVGAQSPHLPGEEGNYSHSFTLFFLFLFHEVDTEKLSESVTWC